MRDVVWFGDFSFIISLKCLSFHIILFLLFLSKPDDYKDIESVVDGPRQVDPNAGSSLPMAPSEEALDELVAKVNSEKK